MESAGLSLLGKLLCVLQQANACTTNLLTPVISQTLSAIPLISSPLDRHRLFPTPLTILDPEIWPGPLPTTPPPHSEAPRHAEGRDPSFQAQRSQVSHYHRDPFP